jgi:hypothetical protein
MCQQCEAIKEELWAEVHDLVNYNAEERGPLSKALDRRVHEIIQEPQFQIMAYLSGMEISKTVADASIEAMRCMMIAQRLAFITMLGDSARGGTAPSMIIGEWAGELLSREIPAIENRAEERHSGHTSPPMEFIREILGELIGDPENAEAEDG